VRITGSDDVRDAKLDLEPAMYVPVTQTPDGMNARNNRVLPITWVVRTAGVLPLGPAAIQRELHQVSAGLPLERIRTMHEVVAASFARTEVYMTLLMAFDGTRWCWPRLACTG
jgi:hypothetical protein